MIRLQCLQREYRVSDIHKNWSDIKTSCFAFRVGKVKKISDTENTETEKRSVIRCNRQKLKSMVNGCISSRSYRRDWPCIFPTLFVSDGFGPKRRFQSFNKTLFACRTIARNSIFTNTATV